MYVWAVGTRAEVDATLDCLTLRICEIGPLTRRFHDDASKIPCLDTLIVESDMCLVLGDRSRVGCGVGLPRIAHSRSWALDSAISRRRFEYSFF